MVTELLIEEVGSRGQRTGSQYGSRTQQLAIDAVAIMVDRVPAAQREGHIGSTPLLDIKAAFKSVGRGRLIHSMRGKGLDGDLIQ